ncbi:gas vesicle protein GvpO, halophile-type [Natrialbaceae archaeon GCM10025810]|uniref:gas vesicle protein GvpO, halophile-type n=1 Tax=Halovalidus salilacus TaxID=3075124 RepID=UPI00361D353B
MAEADTNATATASERCRALTEAGERCSRPAGADGFCFQHDESDQTVSDSQAVENETEETDDAEAEEQQEQEQEQEQQSDDESESRGDTESESESPSASESDTSSEGTTDPSDVDTSDLEEEEIEVQADQSKIEGVLAVRRTVQSTAGELIGRPFDGVSEISPTEDGWRAVVEVIERSSIPDTQDVMGRYEIDLDEDGVVQGYRRLDRYRRGDTKAFE